MVDMQDMRSKRKLKVPESAFKDGPQGLKCAALHFYACWMWAQAHAVLLQCW